MAARYPGPRHLVTPVCQESQHLGRESHMLAHAAPVRPQGSTSWPTGPGFQATSHR